MPALKERQIRLVHELMYHIKVAEVMTPDPVCFESTATFREIQLCMKRRRFSGTPIVEKDQLAGMVSIDDIITAFDHGWIDQPVREHMTWNPVTIPQNYSVIAASNIFGKHRYGRLPVIESPSSLRLVGILTFSDILSHLLVKMNTIAERIEEQERSLNLVNQNATDSLHFELTPDNFDLAGTASTSVKKHLKDQGLSPKLGRRVAVVCYEAEMNVIIHSLGGTMDVHRLEDRIRVVLSDEGPGIPNLDEALNAGYTTANEKIRALGFGAGMGLCNIKRTADRFTIRSAMDSGTELIVDIFLESGDYRDEIGEQ